MGQNREPRNGPIAIWPTNLWQSRREYPIEKRQSLQQIVLENCMATCRRMKLDRFLTLYTKINLKWMKDLNMRQETIKIIEENRGSNLWPYSQSNFLLDMSPKTRETKANLNYWDVIKIQSFCTVKETINKTKRQPMKWEKIFVNDIADKRLVYRGAWVAQSVKRPTSARSRSHGPWVRAPRQALGWWLRAWSLFPILCLPLSLPLPHSCSVSLCPKNK